MDNSSNCVLVGSIQKFSVEDGPGIRTTVFLKGCPLRCAWCHNPELIEPTQQLVRVRANCIGCGCCAEVCPKGALTLSAEDGVTIDRALCGLCLLCTEACYAKALRPAAKLMNAEEILRIAEEDKRFYEHTGGGITISGGEALMHAGFVKSLVDAAAERGMGVCLDTSGYGDPKALMEIASKENVTDILYDMKSVEDETHMAYTGVSNRLIISNLRMLAGNKKTKDKLIMRMPLIRGINDTPEMIRHTEELYKELGLRRVELLPYHILGINKSRNIGSFQEAFEAPTEERMEELALWRERI